MRSLAMAVALALVGGCASAPKEQHYTLSATAAGAPVASLPNAAIAVGLARVNDVVDRPQLVMRASDNRVQILEQQRWAEPLKAGIPRVVAANLGRLLGTPNASAYPKAEAADIAYRVGLDVQRFESRPGDGVTLEIAWSVRGRNSAAAHTGRSALTEPAPGGDYEALVAAHSRALERVSREIAEAIRGLR
jgi:uncharacterized lipoprotein YmbA